ncbi:MAG: proton-conducting transporter membrane subunit [Micromonosporaceae bacterium]
MTIAGAAAAFLLIAPPVVALAMLRAPVRACQGLTTAAGVASFAAVIALVPAAAHRDVALGHYVRADAISVVFLLATSFLYAAVAAYSIGYLGRSPDAGFTRYARRFYAGLNLFAWSMLAAPLMSSLALLWIAVEVTTVISALLVAIEDTDSAVEAAWKYVLIASAGLGIALLATIFMYAAGAHALGQTYNLAIEPLLHAAPHLPHATVRLAFVLAVVGFGTKVGLFPVHTWLPDAHSEAPTPVSALLSGSLLAVSFYAIVRYYQVSTAALGPGFCQAVLLTFGVASLLLAALYLLDQHDLKRLLAYSSVEHMGILAIGLSFGAPVALAGVLLHVLAHAAAKGNAFMGAGVLVRKYGTKRVGSIRGGIDLLPWSGPLLLMAVLALSAMPPFGIFRSEFQIVSGGFAASKNTAAAVLLILVTLAFLGLSVASNRMLLNPRATERLPRSAPLAAHAGSPGHGGAGNSPQEAERPPGLTLPPGEPSAWMVVPVLAGIAVLLVLGVHPPGHLTALLARGVAELRGLA